MTPQSDVTSSVCPWYGSVESFGTGDSWRADHCTTELYSRSSACLPVEENGIQIQRVNRRGRIFTPAAGLLTFFENSARSAADRSLFSFATERNRTQTHRCCSTGSSSSSTTQIVLVSSTLLFLVQRGMYTKIATMMVMDSSHTVSVGRSIAQHVPEARDTRCIFRSTVIPYSLLADVTRCRSNMERQRHAGIMGVCKPAPVKTICYSIPSFFRCCVDCHCTRKRSHHCRNSFLAFPIV